MKQIFINLPVENIENVMAFYTQLGFSNKPLFSDSQQKCMVWSIHIYIMLLTQETFLRYCKNKISEKTNSNAYFSLPIESVEDVNTSVEKGLKAGGKEPIPMIVEGFLQIRHIEDLDGYI